MSFGTQRRLSRSSSWCSWVTHDDSYSWLYRYKWSPGHIMRWKRLKDPDSRLPSTVTSESEHERRDSSPLVAVTWCAPACECTYIVVDLSHGAAGGCPYSALKNCSRLSQCLLETHPPPQHAENSPGKPNPWVFSAFKSYPCRQDRTLCRSQWMHALQTSVSNVCGSFHVKSPRVPHDPSQMFPKKILNIPKCVLRTQTKF